MIELVQICVNYDDFLEITLPINKQYFDNVIIVTSENDLKTQELCKRLDVNCVVTQDFYKNNNKFNKGAGFNAGFKTLKYNDWVCVMDSDTVLQERIIEYGLHAQFFYGCRRYSIPKRSDWELVKQDKNNLKNYLLFRGFGYGYFQLFNYKSNVIKFLIENNYPIYPETPTGAESDWIFRNYWGNLIFDPPLDDNPHIHQNNNDHGVDFLLELPISVLHLGIEGVNETGRFTERF